MGTDPHGDPVGPGTVGLTVAPPLTGLARAAGSMPTIAGPVDVSWRRRGGGVALDLAVPPNARAVVHLPASEPSSVREGGIAAAKAVGVGVSALTGRTAVLAVGSGTYHFTSA
jgi:alpha-L-rhamnosidase